MRRSLGNPESAPRCANCGYSLYGLPAPKCPECGTPFDPKEITFDQMEDDPENEGIIRAIRIERRMGYLGILLLVAGLVFMGLAIYEHPSIGPGMRRRDPRVLVFVVPICLVVYWKVDEDLAGRTVFWTGLVVFGLSFLTYILA